MKRILSICVLLFSMSGAYGQEDTHRNSEVGIPSNSVKILLADFYARGTSYGRIPIPERGCAKMVNIYY